MVIFIILAFIAALPYCDYEEKKAPKPYMGIVNGICTKDFKAGEMLWISMDEYNALTNVNPTHEVSLNTED